MLMDNSCEIVGFRNDPLFVLSRKKWAGMMDGGKEGGREGGREGEYELWNYLFNGTVTRICLLNAEIHRLTCINHPLNMNHFTAVPDRLSSTIQLELDMK